MCKSLNKNQKNILVVILIIVHIVAIAFFFSCFKKKITSQPCKEKVITEEEVLKLQGAGTVGEVSGEETEGEGLILLPPTLFNTSGTISQIKTDRLIIQGDGTNFADGKPRELTLIFTASSVIFDSETKNLYQGLGGLSHLKIGMKIAIEGIENIRGKTEFIVSSITTLLK
jgi:hypothetical protein